MLHVLLESTGARSGEKGGWTVASVLAHTGIIAAAVVLTAHDAPAKRAPSERAIASLYVAPPATRVARPYTRAGAFSTATRADIPRFDVPDVPTSLPGLPLALGEVPAPAWPGTPVPIGAAPPSALAIPSGAVHPEQHVERPVSPSPRNGAPDYPNALRRAAVEGTVLVAFVVDTLGRVEAESVRIVSATHQLFAESVRRWITETRYAPARVRGAPVRQLVQQQVRFALQEGR